MKKIQFQLCKQYKWKIHLKKPTFMQYEKNLRC